MFSSSPRKDASGETTTEEYVGKFKGLITVTNKADEDNRKLAINNRLARIRELIGNIFAKKYNGKSSPLKAGFFCEVDDKLLDR
jgi:hypothetical protein